MARLQDRALSPAYNKSEHFQPLHPGQISPGLELKKIRKFMDIETRSMELPARNSDCGASSGDSESDDEFQCASDKLKRQQMIKLQPISKQRLLHPNSKFKSPTCSARSKSFCVQDTRMSRSSPQKKSSEVLIPQFIIVISLTME